MLSFRNFLWTLPWIVSSTSILSWNIGLEEIWANSRAPAIISNLNEMNPDFACLIEVWGGPSRIRQFIQELPQYKYHLTLVDESYINSTSNLQYSPPCTIDSELQTINTLMKCITHGCTMSSVDDMNCYLTCLSSIYSESPCYACLVEQVYTIYYGTKEYLDTGRILEIPALLNNLQVCDTDTTQPWIQTLGLLILSKTPIEVIQTGFYPTFAVPRGFFMVEFPAEGNNILTTCTHFTVPDVSVPYISGITTNYTSWSEENEGESRIITGIINGMDWGKQMVLVGHLDHGPAVPDLNVSAVDVRSYNIIKSYNWTDLYIKLIYHVLLVITIMYLQP